MINTSMTKSMMWRTTYAIGAYGVALLLAYVGVVFAGNEARGLVIRVLASGALFLAAIVCAALGRSEMRDGRSTSSGRVRSD